MESRKAGKKKIPNKTQRRKGGIGIFIFSPFRIFRSASGQVLIIATLVLALMLGLSSAFLTSLYGGARTQGTVSRQQALREAAAAGVYRSIWCLNQAAGAACAGLSGGNYPGESGLVYGTVKVSVTVTAVGGEWRDITSRAALGGNTRSVRARARQNTSGVAFQYATQIGDDGLTIEKNAKVNGDVYVNGSILGDDKTKSIINGNATAANNTINKVTVNGTAKADTISNSVINGDAYYKTLTGSTVSGASFPNSPTPPPLAFPITDDILNQWRADAATGGTIEGDYTPEAGKTFSLGPIEITGDLHLENNQIMNQTGTVYVHGFVWFDNNAAIHLDPSYGSRSGVLLSDGPMHLKNNGEFQGADEGSYVLLVTTASGGGHHDAAVDLHNNASGTIFYAGNGLINFHNNVDAGEITAKSLHLSSGAILDYNTNMQNIVVVSSPIMSWVLSRGTWRELP